MFGYSGSVTINSIDKVGKVILGKWERMSLEHVPGWDI
jgi:hypothetical protein